MTRQPALGLAGLLLVVPVAWLLAVGAGGPEPTLLVLAPLVTYGLPVIAMSTSGGRTGRVPGCGRAGRAGPTRC